MCVSESEWENERPREEENKDKTTDDGKQSWEPLVKKEEEKKKRKIHPQKMTSGENEITFPLFMVSTMRYYQLQKGIRRGKWDGGRACNGEGGISIDISIQTGGPGTDRAHEELLQRACER